MKIWVLLTSVSETCEVRGPECPKLACFAPAREHHRSGGLGASGRSSWTGPGLSCSVRDAAGCPKEPRLDESRLWRKRGRTWKAREGRGVSEAECINPGNVSKC